MAVSHSIRLRIIALHNQHDMSVKDIRTVLGLKRATVYRIIRTFRLSGSLSVQKTGHRPLILSTADQSSLSSYIHSSNTLYLDEMQRKLLEERGKAVSLATVSRSLDRMNYSRKAISGTAIERNDMRRASFMCKIADMVSDPAMLMFTDESAKDERTQDRRNGWS